MDLSHVILVRLLDSLNETYARKVFSLLYTFICMLLLLPLVHVIMFTVSVSVRMYVSLSWKSWSKRVHSGCWWSQTMNNLLRIACKANSYWDYQYASLSICVLVGDNDKHVKFLIMFFFWKLGLRCIPTRKTNIKYNRKHLGKHVATIYF